MLKLASVWPHVLVLKSKKIVDVAPKIRRLIDVTSPNLPQANEVRADRRYSRSIPVFLADWKTPGRPDEVENMGFGFTLDMSDSGFSVLTKFRPLVHDNIIGLYLNSEDSEEPWFFHVEFARYERLPQKFKRIGYRVIEFINEDHQEFARYLEELMRETLEKDVQYNDGR